MLVELKAIAYAGKGRRTVAAVAATLLLAAQLLIAAHVHPGMLIKGIADRTHIAAVSEVACPVCALHVHAPGNANAVFLLIIPFLSEAYVATARRSRLLCLAKPQLFGRAPPAPA
ncbi:MAG: hypothetical protein ACLQU2_34075 [Candidatus Binataceae bacterium]